MMQSLDLNGIWKLRFNDGGRGATYPANLDTFDELRYMDATVPGEVHLDLLKAGIIEDPYKGLGMLSSRWIEEAIWGYRKEFTAPAEALQPDQRAWFLFEGIDLAAKIVLNGQQIAEHANAFRPLRVEVTGKMRPGMNVLAVHLEAGLIHVRNRPADGYVTFQGHPLAKRVWLRKPQFQFTWDWATRLVNVGLFGAVSLQFTADPVRIDQFVPLADVSEDLKTGTVRARLFAENLSNAPIEVELAVEILETGDRAVAKTSLKPGLHAIETALTVANPKLWWPIGHGDQTLYTLRATVGVGGKILGECTKRIGFRKMRVNQDPHPVAGRRFHFEINNRRIFVKGANWIPTDMIVHQAGDPDRLKKSIALAKEANFNFLRINAVGLYESDLFVDLCDEAGIMLWQEFTFTNAKYPIHDEPFYNDLKTEMTWNVRRLANHPSLVAWCGNNEQEWDAWERGGDRGMVLVDYALYHLTIPRLLQAEDPGRFYQPSSPYSPDGLPPNSPDVGNQHPWNVSFSTTDFRTYRARTDRFASEGGLLGPTALPTIGDCLPKGHEHFGSFGFTMHDNTLGAEPDQPKCDEIFQQWFGRQPRTLSLEHFCYLGGILQGEALREYVENYRRRSWGAAGTPEADRFTSAAAVFWMFNDCWPAVRSWSIIDYSLRRTPSFHPVRRAMAPVALAIALEENLVKIFGLNDTQQTIEADLRFGAMTLAGGYPIDRREKVSLPANASTMIASFSANEWKDRSASAAFAMLERNGATLARARWFEPLFKEITWPSSPMIDVKVTDGIATFNCLVFAWNVCLDLTGELPLADNFFDLFPGVPHSIPWSEKQAPSVKFVGNAFFK